MNKQKLNHIYVLFKTHKILLLVLPPLFFQNILSQLEMSVNYKSNPLL